MTVTSELVRLGRLPHPTATRARRAMVRQRIGLVLLAAGLFTASWDRLANIGLGPYNVKLPSVLFSLAAVAALTLSPWRRLRGPFKVTLRRVAALAASALVVQVVATAVSDHPQPGPAQIAALLSGALLPALAIVALIEDRATLLWSMRWFVAGAVVASIFGIYQLTAFYLGLPQLIDYSGTGVASSVGRIAAFSYEPAYFANFLLLAMGVAASLAFVEGRVIGWLPVAWFSVVLTLANVRALLFIIPVVLALLAIRWRRNRFLILRFAIVGLVTVLANVGITAAVASSQQQSISAPVVEAPTPPRAAESSAGPTASARSRPAEPPRASKHPTQAGPALQNPLDPNEQSSNAPRLALYLAVARVAAAHPLLGVGPGALGWALARDGYLAPNQGGVTVANNIWLQAMVDGGVPLVLVELLIVVSMVLVLLDRRLDAVQPMISVWLGVLLVSGLLTSYFFDVKIWIVLGLAVAATVDLHRGPVVSRARTPEVP